MEAPAPILAGAEAAPRLRFAVEDGGVLEPAAVPTLRFALRVEASAPVRSLSLNVQLRIAAVQRSYSDGEEERLIELFGLPAAWGRSLRSIHWTNLAVTVPAFTDATVVELPVTCTYDLEVTASRYLDALQDGDVPLEFLFGGTLFYGERLQVQPIAWDEEAHYRLPVAVWREMMERHFPGSAWLRLDRAAFERLHAYRARHQLLTWEAAIERLLEERE